MKFNLCTVEVRRDSTHNPWEWVREHVLQGNIEFLKRDVTAMMIGQWLRKHGYLTVESVGRIKVDINIGGHYLEKHGITIYNYNDKQPLFVFRRMM